MFEKQEVERISVLRNVVWTHLNQLSQQCVTSDEVTPHRVVMHTLTLLMCYLSYYSVMCPVAIFLKVLIQLIPWHKSIKQCVQQTLHPATLSGSSQSSSCNSGLSLSRGNQKLPHLSHAVLYFKTACTVIHM